MARLLLAGLPATALLLSAGPAPAKATCRAGYELKGGACVYTGIKRGEYTGPNGFDVASVGPDRTVAMRFAPAPFDARGCPEPAAPSLHIAVGAVELRIRGARVGATVRQPGAVVGSSVYLRGPMRYENAVTVSVEARFTSLSRFAGTITVHETQFENHVKSAECTRSWPFAVTYDARRSSSRS